MLPKEFERDTLMTSPLMTREEFEATIPASALFNLRAYLVLVTSDMPARDKLMGVNGFHSYNYCHYCRIRGVYGPGSIYCPTSPPSEDTIPSTMLQREDFRSEMGNWQCHRQYQSVQLGDNMLWTDAEMREAAVNNMPPFKRDRGSVEQRRPRAPSPLWRLSSLIWPWAFAIDPMHLFYLNIAKRMIEHWSGKFFPRGRNGIGSEFPIDEELEVYHITPATWKAIDDDILLMDLPTSFGDRVRSVDQLQKANELKTWVLIVSPIVLRGRLSNQYYNHWMLFVEAVRLSIDYTISIADPSAAPIDPHSSGTSSHQDNVSRIGYLMTKFVIEYEDMYYRKNYGRLSACRSTFHALLHLEQTIRWSGPSWSYAQWTCERMAGLWKAMVKQRNFLANRNLTLNLLRLARGYALPSRLIPCIGITTGEFEKRNDESIWNVILCKFLGVPRPNQNSYDMITSDHYTATLHARSPRARYYLKVPELRNLRLYLQNEGEHELPPEVARGSGNVETYAGRWKRCMLRKDDADVASYNAYIRGSEWELEENRDSTHVIYTNWDGRRCFGRVKFFVNYRDRLLAYVQRENVERIRATPTGLFLYKRLGRATTGATNVNLLRRFINIDDIEQLVGLVAHQKNNVYFVSRGSCFHSEVE